MVHGGDGDIKTLFQFKGPAAPHFKISRESQAASQQEGVSVAPDQRQVPPHRASRVGPAGLELWARDWQGVRTTFWEAETKRPK